MKLDCVVLVACRRSAMYKVVHKMMQKHSGKSPIPVDAEKLQSVRARPFCCCGCVDSFLFGADLTTAMLAAVL